MSDPRTVGVRLPNWLGDVVMATPALRALRAAKPDAVITAFCQQGHVPFVARLPSVDRVVGLPPEEGVSRHWRAGETRVLREARVETLLLLPAGLSCAIAAVRARIPRRIGWSANGRGWLLTTPIPGHAAAAAGPTPQLYLEVVAAVGAFDMGKEYDVPLTPEDRVAAADLVRFLGLDATRPWIVLNPGSAGVSGKALSARRVAELGRELVAACDRDVVVHVGPMDTELGAAVARCDVPRVRVTHRQAPALGALIGLLAGAALVVSTDSGPRHLAVGLGRPVVVLLGPVSGRLSAWNLTRSAVLSAPSGLADDIPDAAVVQAALRLLNA